LGRAGWPLPARAAVLAALPGDDLRDQQLKLFTDAILEDQGETQRLVRQVSQNIEIATQQAQEDNDNLIQALDDLREQIKDLTEVMAEANGIWR